MKNDKLPTLFLKICNDSLFKNALYLIASQLSTLILGFFFWIIAAKYYTPHQIGIVSAIISSMLLITMISTLGFNTSLVFYLPRNRNASMILNSCLIVSIIASLIFSLTFISGLDLWVPLLKPELGSLKPAMFFIAITVASTISMLISSAFRAGRRSSFQMTKDTFFGLVKIFPLPLFACFGAVGIFLSWGIGTMLAVLLGFILLSKVWQYSPKLVLDPIIESMVGYSAANYIAEIFYSVPRLALPIIIVNLISAEDAGFFYIAMTVAGLLHGISNSISNSLLAEASNTGKLWSNVRKAVRFNVALLIPGLLLFIIFGKFVLTLFNPSYAMNASTTLIILAVASLPYSLVSIFNTVRNAQKRVSSVVKINVTIALITLALSMLLIPLGIEGVAAAFLASYTIAALVIIYKMQNPVEFISKLR